MLQCDGSFDDVAAQCCIISIQPPTQPTVLEMAQQVPPKHARPVPAQVEFESIS
jgi:hypothetical protein